ncbi:MAG: 30S ribosomal protein S17 [Acidobacteriota bacterium]|nr:30S ribosomal protein S17 [Acidobacteriota bacterium]
MSEAAAKAERAPRQSMVGTVVSDTMDKTVVVEVEKTLLHQLYRRYVKRRKRYYAHDEKNECAIGDKVEIRASRPLSRLKRWRLQRVLEKGKGS